MVNVNSTCLDGFQRRNIRKMLMCARYSPDPAPRDSDKSQRDGKSASASPIHLEKILKSLLNLIGSNGRG